MTPNREQTAAGAGMKRKMPAWQDKAGAERKRKEKNEEKSRKQEG